MLLSTPKEPCWLGSATHLPLVSWTDSIIKWDKVWGFRLWNIQDYFNFLLLYLFRKCFITKCPSCHCWAASGSLLTPSWLQATDAPHSGKQQQLPSIINFNQQSVNASRFGMQVRHRCQHWESQKSRTLGEQGHRTQDIYVFRECHENV